MVKTLRHCLKQQEFSLRYKQDPWEYFQLFTVLKIRKWVSWIYRFLQILPRTRPLFSWKIFRQDDLGIVQPQIEYKLDCFSKQLQVTSTAILFDWEKYWIRTGTQWRSWKQWQILITYLNFYPYPWSLPQNSVYIGFLSIVFHQF